MLLRVEDHDTGVRGGSRGATLSLSLGAVLHGGHCIVVEGDGGERVVLWWRWGGEGWLRL